jgi:hypothetical protein
MRPKNQLRLARHTLLLHVPACEKLGFKAQAHTLKKLAEEIIQRNEGKTA